MTEADETWRESLIAAALAAQQRAYAPYSQFQVGAAILHTNAMIFTGANVENVSYGLTVCAERVAAGWAVTAEEVSAGVLSTVDGVSSHNWRAIAIASRGGVTPCGACRQFLMEFAPDMEVLLVDSTTRSVASIDALRLLLPAAFEFRPHLRQD